MQEPTFPPEGHHTSTCSCPNPSCPRRGQPGAGNIAHRSWTGKDKTIERLRCQVCGQEFSERRGTWMEGTKLPEETVERLLKCQRWGGVTKGPPTSAGSTSRPCISCSTSRPYALRRITRRSPMISGSQRSNWTRCTPNGVVTTSSGCTRPSPWAAASCCGCTGDPARRRVWPCWWHRWWRAWIACRCG
jgi:hypothetical protein